MKMDEDDQIPLETGVDELKQELKAAKQRAVKAEKAFLHLKLESFQVKMDNEIKAAEEQYSTKINLYANMPEQASRIKDEFTKKTHELLHQKDQAERVSKLCVQALDDGLTMDDLPLSTENAEDVKKIIEEKFREKQAIRRQQLKNGQSPPTANNIHRNPLAGGGPYLPQNMAPQQMYNTVSNGYGVYPPHVQQHQMQQRHQPHHQQLQQRQNYHQNNAPPPQKNSLLQSGQQSSQRAPATMSMFMTPPIQPPHNTNGNAYKNQYNVMNGALIQQSQQLAVNDRNNSMIGNLSVGVSQRTSVVERGPSQPSPTYVKGGPLNSPSMSSGGESTDIAQVFDQYSSLGSQIHTDSPPAKINGQALSKTDDLVSSLSNVMIGDNLSNAGSGVGSMDNFVIDDDMFQGGLSQASYVDDAYIDSGQGDAKSRNNLNGGLESFEESVGDKSDSEAGSVSSDDEEFARNLASRQGTNGTNAAVTKPTPAVAVASKSETKGGKFDSTDDVDWNEEPYLTIVDNLSGKYKISKKVARDNLEAAARKAGGVTELDAVWAEAVQRVRNALKSNPLQTFTKPAAPTTTITKAVETGGAYSNFKTKVCENWKRDKKCPHGEYCNFAHGYGELRAYGPISATQASAATSSADVDGPDKNAPTTYYKVTMCRNYEATGECRWGIDCIFAHGKDELRRPGVRDHNTDEQFNAANHDEPCNNQQCSGRLQYLLRKTSMCERNKEGTCYYGKECKFAHSKKELKPLPKWEMCENHRRGKCKQAYYPDKCVYAHSASELRKKPAEMEKSAAQSSASGGRLIQPGTKHVPWAGNDKHPDTPSDADECQICMGPLMKYQRKNLLKCGHNNFHERCISQWVNEGSSSCPICRHPAKVPDLFKAPAGFKPEEFPGLGL